MHLHTDHSDGADSPEQVVERAVQCGLAAIAITDHDTCAGLEKAEAAANEKGLQFLSGVEISTVWDGTEVHVLGYGIRQDDSALDAALAGLCEGRVQRADAIIAKLRNLGVQVDAERIMTQAAGGSIGRMHIAQEVQRLGFSGSVQAAFDEYIGAGRPAFVATKKLSSDEAINLIHDAGGLAFVAHPGFSATRKMLGRLLELPFDGIEAYHTRHKPDRVSTLLAVARERGLLISGGSDCHGSIKGGEPEMGKVRVPFEHFASLIAALRVRGYNRIS